MGYRIGKTLKSSHLIDNRNHIGWFTVRVIAVHRMCNGFQVKNLEDAKTVVDEIAGYRKQQGLATTRAYALEILSKDRKGRVTHGEPQEIEITI